MRSGVLKRVVAGLPENLGQQLLQTTPITLHILLAAQCSVQYKPAQKTQKTESQTVVKRCSMCEHERRVWLLMSGLDRACVEGRWVWLDGGRYMACGRSFTRIRLLDDKW